MALAFELAHIRHEELFAMRILALPGGVHARTVPLRRLADNPSFATPQPGSQVEENPPKKR